MINIEEYQDFESKSFKILESVKSQTLTTAKEQSQKGVSQEALVHIAYNLTEEAIENLKIRLYQTFDAKENEEYNDLIFFFIETHKNDFYAPNKFRDEVQQILQQGVKV